MNHATTAKDSDNCIQRPDGFDLLIGAVAADTAAAALARAAFDAILNGQLVLAAELARAAGASTEDVAGLTGRGLMVDDQGRVVAAHGLSLVRHQATFFDRTGFLG